MVLWYSTGVASVHPHLIHVSLGPAESKSQAASRSVQPFLHSSRQRLAMLYNGLPVFPLNIALSHGGYWPPSNTWFLGPVRAYNQNGISIGSAVFAQLTAECPYTLQWAAPSPSQLFLGPTGVYNRNGISIGSAIFVGLTTVLCRQTDRQTTLLGRCNNKPFLRT